MNTVLKAQASSLHTNYTIIYRFTMAVSTLYNLQKSTLQKFKNSKYQKGTVEETGTNLAASKCDREVAS